MCTALWDLVFWKLYIRMLWNLSSTKEILISIAKGDISIDYKGTTLKHQFYADFVVMDKIILEVKSQDGLPEVFSAQLLNYLRVSGNRLGVIANFYGTSLQTKRIVL